MNVFDSNRPKSVIRTSESGLQSSYNDYLCHYGIKGQKWGIRRFQEEDGSLTAVGKERYKVPGIKGQSWGVRRYLRDDGTLTKLGEKHYGANYTKRERPGRIIKNLRKSQLGYEKEDSKRFKDQLKLNRMEKRNSENKELNDPKTKLGAKHAKVRDRLEARNVRLSYLQKYQASILNKASEQNNTRKFKKKMAKIGLNSAYFRKMAENAQLKDSVDKFLKRMALD